MDANYLYFMQLLLCAVFFIGIEYVSYLCPIRHYRFLKVLLKERCSYTYGILFKHIEKEDMCAYDKYQIWRYIEKRRESLFIRK